MNRDLDQRRILLYLLFSFGIAWGTALVIYLTGGLVNSPVIVPGITLATVLMAVPYMYAPALGVILTRLLTRESWKDGFLALRFKRGWPWLLIAWFLPGLLTILGASLYFLVFPGHLDLSFPIFSKVPLPEGITPQTIAVLQLVQAFIFVPVNMLFTFGEELGWRGYLQFKLLPLGPRAMLFWMGLIWGAWHWPLIWMGYEYGFHYPGYPWTGPALFCWIAFCFGVLLSWVALRGGSVWPAVVGHAAINAIAGLGILALAENANNNPLLGPLVVGVVGGAGYGLLALMLWIFAPAWAKPEDQPVELS